MANTILYTADSRGKAEHGWLHSNFSFSFADYYDKTRLHFGALRVLNDDVVDGGSGFGMHPHDNMEIITITLEGDLEHSDNMGNKEIVRHGDIQVMSAGTGVYHSEYNPNPDIPVKLLQIWVFPNKRNVKPRYDQMTMNVADRENKFQQVLSPNPDDAGVWIHQNAWFHMGKFEAGKEAEYTLKSPGNGIYAFVISGDVSIDGQALHLRDALGISDTEKINIKFDTAGELLLMEVPMNLN